MISQDKELTGVAPDAMLFSSAVGELSELSSQPQECFSAQAVALRNSDDVRAINFSFGEPLSRDPRPSATLDGNALLTQCIDWSGRLHKVLYVIAGNQGGGGIPIPTDNFNGMNIANATVVDGEFARVDSSNLGSEPPVTIPGMEPESNEGPRRSINLLAPGSNIEMLDPDGYQVFSSGTSFAAPHVVATIALLQEFGDRQIRAGVSNWSLASREPQVMKAILMNSADKLKDTGDGMLLGMTRTVVDQKGRNWLESDAARDPKIPLQADFGTGHLNAYRAYTQFNGGQWAPGEVAPTIGWAYAPELTPQSVNDYVFDQPLQGGSYFSATLTWERFVNLNDANNNGIYDQGESFSGQPLNNVDLYLMPEAEEDLSKSVWSSVSDADSVEHIFYQIPTTGRYKLRVVYRQQLANVAIQPYALAWWAKPAP
jgi:subtilisin family serine protease